MVPISCSRVSNIRLKHIIRDPPKHQTNKKNNLGCFALRMGGCFSSKIGEMGVAGGPSCAMVISLNGALKEYPVPAKLADVIADETALSASSSSSSDYFLCNSDGLYYDQFIPALDMEDELYANQIYFVLPSSKLEKRLTASEMAALAVKASTAFQNHDRRHRKKKARISPVLPGSAWKSSDGIHEEDDIVVIETFGKPKLTKPHRKPDEPWLQKSGTETFLQRHASRRAKLAIGSFHLRMSTIHEGHDSALD